MLAYARMLSAIFGHLGTDNQPLKALASSLRGAGAAIPLTQAEAIPRDTLIGWALRQSPSICLAAMLAWKTASRWSEVAALSRANFVLVTDTEVIIDWSTLPKGRRGNPYSKSRMVVVTGPLTEGIASLVRSLGGFRKLTQVSTDGLASLWRAEPAMRQYTAHSIKRGAVDHLVAAKAAGAQFPEHLISRLAKHVNETHPTVADMTIRYTTDPIPLARVLRTAEVTAHL
ncbi:hypothetical protein DIPPA_27588 [Diplonema papillatum]|nr:hypothetical protein DIPPA_27588 [Diplonema papillatum]